MKHGARTVTPRSRRAWRTWLERYHDSAAEVWLVFYKQGTGKPTLTYADAVEEALCFGWIDGVKRSLDAERYMHRFSPRTTASRWSATNRARVAKLEKVGAIAPAGRRAVAHAKRSGRWDVPRPALDVAVPAELAARLRQDTKAASFFAALAPSYQQQFTAWINAAKRPETRRRRLEESVALLARGAKLGLR
jgi:uncharacterized protein YdeI (YjbR/CyaY-like superfamily)